MSSPSSCQPSRAHIDDSRPGRSGAPERNRIKRYNLAIWRLINGKGSATRELAVLTGLTPKAIERRSAKAGQQYSDNELRGEDGGLTYAERKYLEIHYTRSQDPSVHDFVKRLSSNQGDSAELN